MKKLRLAAFLEYLRGALWVMPTALVVGALALGTLLVQWQPAAVPLVDAWVFEGDIDGARAVLATVAGAMITVTGLTFSLTIIALQMASSQFSPRVLRGFLSDRGNQFVLSLLLATFAYSLAVLRSITAGEGGDAVGVPRVAVTVGFVLSLAAVGALVYFLHHLSRQLRAQTILADVAGDTMKTIRTLHPDGVPPDHEGVPPPQPPADSVRVRARRSGYVQAVELGGLVEAARRADTVVRLRAPLGSHVTKGTTLAWVWPRCEDGGGAAGRDGAVAAGDGAGGDGSGNGPRDGDDGRGDEELHHVAHDHIQLGTERTFQQDVAFGLRQLVDIAVKALSTGLNDPTTAVDTLGHLADLSCALAARRLGTWVGCDDDGVVRAVVPRPQFRDYLSLMCDQIRRYGGEEPAVLRALLALLTDTAEVACTDEQRAAVRDEVARTVEVAQRCLDETEMTRIQGAVDLALLTLEQQRRPDPETLAQ